MEISAAANAKEHVGSFLPKYNSSNFMKMVVAEQNKKNPSDEKEALIDQILYVDGKKDKGFRPEITGSLKIFVRDVKQASTDFIRSMVGRYNVSLVIVGITEGLKFKEELEKVFADMKNYSRAKVDTAIKKLQDNLGQGYTDYKWELIAGSKGKYQYVAQKKTKANLFKSAVDEFVKEAKQAAENYEAEKAIYDKI